MKICKTCQKPKEDSHFYLIMGKYLHPSCKTCDIIRRGKQRGLLDTKTRKNKQNTHYKQYGHKILEYRKRRRMLGLNTTEKRWHRKYNIKRRLNEPEFKILCNLRGRIRSALKNTRKSKTTKELLGCSIPSLKAHLESKFQPNMSWENYGKWHIDHIKPCSSFDLTDLNQQKQCFHHLNLQPLWAKDNLSKSDKTKG